MASGDGYVVAVLRERYGLRHPVAAVLANPCIIEIQAHRLVRHDLLSPSSYEEWQVLWAIAVMKYIHLSVYLFI